MRKRIYWSLCLVSLAALICSTVASLSLYISILQRTDSSGLKKSMLCAGSWHTAV